MQRLYDVTPEQQLRTLPRVGEEGGGWQRLWRKGRSGGGWPPGTASYRVEISIYSGAAVGNEVLQNIPKQLDEKVLGAENLRRVGDKLTRWQTKYIEISSSTPNTHNRYMPIRKRNHAKPMHGFCSTHGSYPQP